MVMQSLFIMTKRTSQKHQDSLDIIQIIYVAIFLTFSKLFEMSPEKYPKAFSHKRFYGSFISHDSYSTFMQWISNFYGYGLDISWIWPEYRGGGDSLLLLFKSSTSSPSIQFSYRMFAKLQQKSPRQQFEADSRRKNAPG